MILQIIQPILWMIILFLPGILLSYIIFPKTDIIKRAVYSIVLAVSISTILSAVLYLLGLLTPMNTVLVLISIILLFLILKLKRKCKTAYNPDVWYLLLFSLIGTIWRLLFLKSIKNFGDAYFYSGKFIGEKVPDLGFYSGMVVDHSNYIGGETANAIFNFFSLNNQYLNVFLITFIFLGLVYLLFGEYRNKKLAFIGVALMCLGPIEIFHSTLSVIGHPLSYISLFLLFLLFKTKDNRMFLTAFLLAIAMMFVYYTASMIIMSSSIGFIIALSTKELIKTKNLGRAFKNSLKNQKILLFLLIFMIVALYTYVFSNMMVYTLDRTQAPLSIKKSISTVTEAVSTKYRDPAFLGLSAIRWQILFFFLMGLTFIFYLIIKMDFSKENLDLLLCLIPILIISYGFIHVNLPIRIFDYFAFFGLLVLKIPKKYLRIFFILSFIFILITGFYVAKDKRVFFETSDKEIEGAREISESFDGRIFSDQSFINQLVLNNYYNVTGAYDEDPLVNDLFYGNNISAFIEAKDYLRINLSVSYIAITKRMREQYILMLNYPSKPIRNMAFYEGELVKVYDNGDAMVYKVEK